MQSQLREAEKQRDEAKAAAEKISEEHAEQERSLLELASLSKEVRAELDAKHAEISNAAQGIAQNTALLSKTREEHEALAAQHAELTGENRRLVEEHGLLDGQHKDLTAAHAKLTSDREGLEQALQSLNTDREVPERVRISSLRRSMRSFSGAYDKLLAQARSLTERQRAPRRRKSKAPGRVPPVGG